MCEGGRKEKGGKGQYVPSRNNTTLIQAERNPSVGWIGLTRRQTIHNPESYLIGLQSDCSDYNPDGLDLIVIDNRDCRNLCASKILPKQALIHQNSSVKMLYF